MGEGLTADQHLTGESVLMDWTRIDNHLRVLKPEGLLGVPPCPVACRLCAHPLFMELRHAQAQKYPSALRVADFLSACDLAVVTSDPSNPVSLLLAGQQGP